MIALSVRFVETKRLHELTVQQAIARGLNEGGDRVRTQVQRALKQQTGVKAYASITSRVGTVRAGPTSLSYAIVAKGKGIPIKEFPVKASLHGPVTADVWANPHTFARSFKTSRQGLLRARVSDASHSKIRSLYGPALPKELGHGIVPAVFLHSAQMFVPQAILKHLAKAWG